MIDQWIQIIGKKDFNNPETGARKNVNELKLSTNVD